MSNARFIYFRGNEKAIRFYERHGFKTTGEKKLEDGTTEYLILMKKYAESFI